MFWRRQCVAGTDWRSVGARATREVGIASSEVASGAAPHNTRRLRVAEAITGLSPLQLPPSPSDQGVTFPYLASNLSNASVSLKLLSGSHVGLA